MGDTLESLTSRWQVQTKESDLGLWWLAEDVREVLGVHATEDEVIKSTLTLVGPLLRSGEIVAAQLSDDSSFHPWGGSAENQLARIETEWRLLGHQPGIDEVVWFVRASRLQP